MKARIASIPLATTGARAPPWGGRGGSPPSVGGRGGGVRVGVSRSRTAVVFVDIARLLPPHRPQVDEDDGEDRDRREDPEEDPAEPAIARGVVGLGAIGRR